MKTSKFALAGLSIALTLASAAVQAEQYTDQARVVSAIPEYDRVNVPRQECYDEYRAEPVSGERSYGGSVIGGITGALVGNQIGRGHGKEAATALGAITGAIVGDRMQNRQIEDQRLSRNVRRCRDIDHWENRLSAYRVVYEYGGHRYVTTMPNDPGSYVRVRVSVDAYED